MPVTPHSEPPRLARHLLARTLPSDVREHVCGDLEESFHRRRTTPGTLRARFWYRRQAISFSIRFAWERLRERVTPPNRAGTPRPTTAPRRMHDARGGWIPAGLSMLDVKLGVRMLVKYPGLTLIGCLAISVAIGISAGCFAFLSNFTHPTLPLPDGERIVGIQNWDVAANAPELRSAHDFAAWRGELRSVTDIGAYTALERNLITADARSEPVNGVAISASAFRLVGVPPLLGRPLVQADEGDAAPPVVVIGYDVWQHRFGGDPAVIGKTVRLGRAMHTVVGVMPKGFAFPVNHDLWVPLRLHAANYARGAGPSIRIFGRLAVDATLEEAQAELTAVASRTAARVPGTNEQLRPRVVPYTQMFASDMFANSATVYVIQSFFVMLLIVACANVATLVFARTAAREREIAVRSALGASRGRIIAQLFIEALVLALVAAVLGLVVAAIGLKWVLALVVASTGEPVPFWWTGALAPGTVLYAGGLTVLGAVIVGVVPALKVTGRKVQERLQRTAGSGSGVRFGWLWTGVIVTQVALSVFFLPDAVSMAREAVQGHAAGAAVPAAEYLSARLEMDGLDGNGPPADSAQAAAFHARYSATYHELEQRLTMEPSVASVAVATRLPGMDHPQRRVEVDDVTAPQDSASSYEVSTAQVGVHFFDAFDVPILSGRAFNSGDAADGRHTAIVNQSFVHRILGDRNAIGRRVRFAAKPGERPSPWYEIVGVVKDLNMNPFSPNEGAGLYRLLSPDASASGSGYPVQMAVRVRGDPASFATQLRSIAAAVDPTLRLYDVQSLDAIGQRVRLSLDLLVSVLALVASIALLLSTAGIYSLVSFTVSRRTREIGIRAALGASSRQIVTAIFSRAAAQVGLGIVIGALGATFIGDQVATEGPGLLLAVAALMLTVGLLACAVPARRALRIQPTEALKEDG
jgi:predicted permease